LKNNEPRTKNMINTHTTLTPVMRSRARLLEWELNPRQGDYGGIDELVESLRRVGQQDAIHVWERPEGDLILKGHRRNAAMDVLGWAECLQVVHDFQTEEEAYLYLLQDHGHTNALDAAEKIVAAENALRLGIGPQETAAAMGVTPERVQLWFAFGEKLPMAAKRALADGDLSYNTAEYLLRVTKEQMAEAVAGVLRDEATGHAMSPSQAVAYLEGKYLRPAQWKLEWLALEPKLKKRLKVIEGYQYVGWDERAEYVQGETGQPWPDYYFADAYMPKNAGKTWGARAAELNVTVYVVSAPRHEDKHVLLVSEKMLRAAESVAGDSLFNVQSSTGDEDEGVITDGSVEVRVKTAETVSVSFEEEAKDARAIRQKLGALWEELAENPTKVMTGGPWETVLPFLAHLVTDVDAGALEAWLGPLTAEQLMVKITADTRQRAPLRWAYLLTVCAAMDAGDGMQGIFDASAMAPATLDSALPKDVMAG